MPQLLEGKKLKRDAAKSFYVILALVLTLSACTQQISGGSSLKSGVCARCENGTPLGPAANEEECAAAANATRCTSYEFKSGGPDCDPLPACFMYQCEIDPTGLPPWLGQFNPPIDAAPGCVQFPEA